MTKPMTTDVNATTRPAAGDRLVRRRGRQLRERGIEALLFLAAASSVAITFAIVAILVTESLPLFREVSLVSFLTDRQWTPCSTTPTSAS